MLNSCVSDVRYNLSRYNLRLALHFPFVLVIGVLFRNDKVSKYI